jgi:hypothetical protein
MANTTWYHGGDLKNGKRTGTYVYVTDRRQYAEAHAREHANGAVYRVRAEYNHLVEDHSGGGGRKVIRQKAIADLGGALSVFEELP